MKSICPVSSSVGFFTTVQNDVKRSVIARHEVPRQSPKTKYVILSASEISHRKSAEHIYSVTPALPGGVGFGQVISIQNFYIQFSFAALTALLEKSKSPVAARGYQIAGF